MPQAKGKPGQVLGVDGKWRDPFPKIDVQAFWAPPPGEIMVGIIQYRDHVYIATDRGVYRTNGDIVEPVIKADNLNSSFVDENGNLIE